MAPQFAELGRPADQRAGIGGGREHRRPVGPAAAAAARGGHEDRTVVGGGVERLRDPLDGVPAWMAVTAFEAADGSHAEPGPVCQLLLGECRFVA